MYRICKIQNSLPTGRQAPASNKIIIINQLTLFMNTQKGFATIVIIIVGVLVLFGAAGYFVFTSKKPCCAVAPQGAAFESSITFEENKQVTFSDGLAVTLLEINDSRCKQGVVCIWAGELSPVFRVTGGAVGKSQKELRLGTLTAKSAIESGYTFALQDVTVDTATMR